MWTPPKLMLKPPPDAIFGGLLSVPTGMASWRNRKNRYVVIACGYYSDEVARTEAWWKSATEGLRPDQVEREYLISFTSRGGQKVFPFLEHNPDKFVRPHTNYRDGFKWKIPRHWPIVGGLDYGATKNPTSINFYAIDDKNVWHSIWEFYKPAHYKEVAETLLKHPLYDRVIKIVADTSIYRDDQQVDTGVFQSVGDLLEKEGIHKLEGANRDRIAGLARVIEQFNQRDNEPNRESLIVFSSDCPNQWNELCRLIYKEETELQLLSRNPSDDVAKKDDHCFSADTKILTRRGYVRIDEVVSGDEVITRVGFRRSISLGMTGIKQTYDLEFTNGSRLRCTANHPIYTETRGFVRSDELRYDDICVSDPKWKKRRSYFREWFLDGIQNLVAPTIETTSNAVRCILSAEFAISIERFGKNIMAQFQPAMLSTIGTAIPVTTTYLTSNVLVPRFIEKGIERAGVKARSLLEERKFGKKIDSKRESGTALKPEGLGMDNMPRRPGRIWSGLKRIVRFAGRDTKPQRVAWRFRSFVIKTAAQKPFGLAVRLKKRTLSSIEPVFNLTVEDQHEYFANGILVHNSYDNCRYALMSWDFPGAVLSKKAGQGTLAQIEEEIDDDKRSEIDDLFN